VTETNFVSVSRFYFVKTNIDIILFPSISYFEFLTLLFQAVEQFSAQMNAENLLTWATRNGSEGDSKAEWKLEWCGD
jgi:hypothetical protein